MTTQSNPTKTEPDDASNTSVRCSHEDVASELVSELKATVKNLSGEVAFQGVRFRAVHTTLESTAIKLKNEEDLRRGLEIRCAELTAELEKTSAKLERRGERAQLLYERGIHAESEWRSAYEYSSVLRNELRLSRSNIPPPPAPYAADYPPPTQREVYKIWKDEVEASRGTKRGLEVTQETQEIQEEGDGHMEGEITNGENGERAQKRRK